MSRYTYFQYGGPTTPPDLRYILVDLEQNLEIAYFKFRADVVNAVVALNDFDNAVKQLRKDKDNTKTGITDGGFPT